MSEVLSLEEKVLDAQEFIRANLSDSSIPTAMMFSGGKDSVVVRHLLESCGINHVKYYYMASGIEGPYLKNYLLENYPDVEWLIPKTDNIFEEWKQRKFVPYSMAKDKRYIAALQRYFCCKSRYLLKAATIRPYTNIIMGVRETDVANTMRYEKRIVTHQNKSYFQPIYHFSRQDIYEYIEKYNIELCKEYKLFNRTRTCPMCPMCPMWANDDNVLRIFKTEYADIYAKFEETVKYCYDNNEYLREQFNTYEEYLECCTDRNKYVNKISTDKYFIDPETGLKYSNETGSVVM